MGFRFVWYNVTKIQRAHAHGTDDSDMGVRVACQRHCRRIDSFLASNRKRPLGGLGRTRRNIWFFVPSTLVGRAFKKFKVRHYPDFCSGG
jgi:hypothetical protein